MLARVMRYLFDSVDPGATVLAVGVSAAPGIQRKLKAELERLIPPLVSVGLATPSRDGWEVVWPAGEKAEVARVLAALLGIPEVWLHTCVVLDEGPPSATLARLRKRLRNGAIVPGSVTDLRRATPADRG